MADWNHDISAAPRGRWEETTRAGRNGDMTVRRYAHDRIIIATACGKVTTSRWLPPDESEKRSQGRWEMLSANEEPVAWQPWPKHPIGENDA